MPSEIIKEGHVLFSSGNGSSTRGAVRCRERLRGLRNYHRGGGWPNGRINFDHTGFSAGTGTDFVVPIALINMR